MKPLNMKDIAIIDAFPTYSYPKTVLEVGCGDGKLDFYLAEMGYRVYGTDIEEYETWRNPPEGLSHMVYKKLQFSKSDIFDLSSFPTKCASVVIASEVLEHLSNWKLALVHLIALAGVRLIITVPYCRSFMHPTHCNFWDDKASPESATGVAPHQFRDIHEFIDICKPFSTSISRIRTKPQDVKMGQYAYLIVVDKRQGLNE